MSFCEGGIGCRVGRGWRAGDGSSPYISSLRAVDW